MRFGMGRCNMPNISLNAYSPNEKILISYFDMENVAQHTFPLTLFVYMGAKAFIMNDQTEYADALRRGLRYLEEGKFRHTTSYEALIDIDYPKNNMV